MKKLFCILVFSALSLFSFAQNYISSDFKKIAVEGGMLLPVSKLQTMMNNSPQVGIWYRKPFDHQSILNYGLSLHFPKSHQFSYKNEDYTTYTKSFAGSACIRLDKPYRISNTVDVEWSTLFGYGFHFYDDVKAREEYEQWPVWKKEDKNVSKPMFIKPFGTLYFGQGVQLNIRDVGIFARYNYSPYSLFTNRIDASFGSSSVSIGISYRQ